MTRYQLESALSKLNLLGEELQAMNGVPDVVDRANDLLWQTADKLSLEVGGRDRESSILSFPAPRPTLPLHVPSLS